MNDGIGLAEALLGLPGFRVLDVTETVSEVVMAIETTAVRVACRTCGVRAEAQDRMRVDVRDLACFGRPARLVWIKRRWRCRESRCSARTWTETSDHVDAQAVLTRRAGVEACRQVGENARPVSQLADELGVCWWTIMNAVIEHGTPLVDDPDRIGPVRQLGVDETSFLAANRHHATVYATGLIDLERHVVIDMVEGNAAADLRRWTSNADPAWLATIEVVATDLAESFRAGLSPHLDHTRRVADPFHVVRVGNRCVDQVRRRVQNETMGHRGRKHDPLYRIRKLLLTAAEQLTGRGRARLRAGLTAGDPAGEVAVAWQGKELLRAVYAAVGTAAARAALERFYHWADSVSVAELSRLARTVRAWEAEILAFHSTEGCSNGPTEAVNLLIKKVKRVGHGFRNFANYRLRLLLHCGVRWQTHRTARLRGRSPRFVA